MNISRREKFVDLAEKRTANTIKQIRLIGNLSNKGNYEYTDADISKIYRTLYGELKAMKERFQTTGSTKDKLFKLDLNQKISI